ncbi:N5-carboxyaminoimidazole ribonucleotide mutase [Acetobacter nitrogenifigens DSM 23921 = NBRC 105050]|uniref:N5-carboxyaminoimidazole ribonucleotide mutase n=1 Tax=Acetobacter nitrogenifigens DSM 23921 = NBRC 105050 TaxID=1120919 RepID=A0A511XA86_9PROT|nr:5-(carboxyamino)imidazole ribonucleotide mutase [Acetobacter nitrogenifigens]GBQ97684.1 N5-carboxyaminoimidazole ribonucleotide mutase [Acetobacter nitrogenifigens DSM 23921 = NBRC 105050]GEN59835.1 N5-carboxyaminoimidazole ribonucleotide mutase [Acetobacter nitrogenifigens DSM 23921 = NBRC 105050]
MTDEPNLPDAISAENTPSETAVAGAPQVGVIMGSQSDWETMRHAIDTLEALGVAYETKIVSAHRTPDRLADYARTAVERGLSVIIAGAGGAAHLPGMCAAWTRLPVLGVPVESHALKGMDSLLSIVQMPGGVPVGTLAIGKAGAINAALLATSILAIGDEILAARLETWRALQTASVRDEPER